MFRQELEDRISAEPFEPFRIKLVNGDRHDIADPQSIAIMTDYVTIASADQHWAIFPFDKINSLESLLPDFLGELAQRSAPSPPPAP
jgi:hypothetical protein